MPTINNKARQAAKKVQTRSTPGSAQYSPHTRRAAGNSEAAHRRTACKGIEATAAHTVRKPGSIAQGQTLDTMQPAHKATAGDVVAPRDNAQQWSGLHFNTRGQRHNGTAGQQGGTTARSKWRDMAAAVPIGAATDAQGSREQRPGPEHIPPTGGGG